MAEAGSKVNSAAQQPNHVAAKPPANWGLHGRMKRDSLFMPTTQEVHHGGFTGSQHE
jgi:hypothetical protein